MQKSCVAFLIAFVGFCSLAEAQTNVTSHRSPLVSGWMDRIDSPNRRESIQAWKHLRELGTNAPAFPVLMACLVSTNINTRCYGAAILRNFGAEAKALVPILHRLMNDITECDDSRIRAAGVMGTIGPNARFAIPEIQRLLISDSHRLRAGAAIALGHFGNLAEGSLPALRSLLKDPDDGIRSIAQRAIVEIENGSGSTASEAKTKGNESQQGGGEERR